MKNFIKAMWPLIEKFTKIVLLAAGFTFFTIRFSPAVEYTPLEFQKEDRILILAPHPDDEAIGAAGVIQRALSLKLPIKVVYLTNGDNNELAFLAFKKHPVLSRPGLVRMGELRSREAVTAMQFLGLQRDQLVFLGYPDFGTLEIFSRHWGESKASRNMLSRVTAVPYKDALSPQAVYKGESILSDLKKVLSEFKPTKIFVTLPVDTNSDHRALYLFLEIALWELQGKIPLPQVYPYIIHIIGWPVPRGFHPDIGLDAPKNLKNADIVWYKLDLTTEEIQQKKKAIGFYKSQITYNPRYLYTFARRNELFGRYNDIYLDKQKDLINWSKLGPTQKFISHLVSLNKFKRGIVRSVAYAREDGNLHIKLDVNNWTSKLSGIDLFLIGYKRGSDFSRLPKLRIHINFDHFITAFNKLDPVFIKDIKFNHKNDSLFLQIPLAALGNPDYILSSTRSHFIDLSLETTEWRTIVVEHNGITK